VRWKSLQQICIRFPAESHSERVVKICVYLPKLWPKNKVAVFVFGTRCILPSPTSQPSDATRSSDTAQIERVALPPKNSLPKNDSLSYIFVDCMNLASVKLLRKLLFSVKWRVTTATWRFKVVQRSSDPSAFVGRFYGVLNNSFSVLDCHRNELTAFVKPWLYTCEIKLFWINFEHYFSVKIFACNHVWNCKMKLFQ